MGYRKRSKRKKIVSFFFFQAEDGFRVSPCSRGLGDVYRGQPPPFFCGRATPSTATAQHFFFYGTGTRLLFTSDAAGEKRGVSSGWRRII